MWWLGIIILGFILVLVIALAIVTRDDPSKGMPFRPEKDINKIYDMNQRRNYYNGKRDD